MEAGEIRYWLLEGDTRRLEELWRLADKTRRDNVGDDVHLRALIEISSHCVRSCLYCGLRAPRADLARYRMEQDEILECAASARKLGYGTVVLQAGEDPGLTREWVAELISHIRKEAGGTNCRCEEEEEEEEEEANAGKMPAVHTGRMPVLRDGETPSPLAITLSLGERTKEELRAWKEAGADRYLLRFETSNRELYGRIHPPLAGRRSDRAAILQGLRRLGYEVGSGVMIGIPGQTYEDLARDIELFVELDLDMIGVGPFIPHPNTPLGAVRGEGVPPLRSTGILPVIASSVYSLSSSPRTETPPSPNLTDQVPPTEEMTYKVIALSRIVCPGANIPSTTALATLNRRDGRELGLMRGANIVMPNMTPVKYRRLYEIYPNKACVAETPADCGACLDNRIRVIGRRAGAGRGDSRRMKTLPTMLSNE